MLREPGTYVDISDIDDHVGLVRPDWAFPAEESSLPLDCCSRYSLEELELMVGCGQAVLT
jgi:hypothetical protein